MSEETKVSERTAIRDAYETAIRRMYEVLLEALVQDNADVEQACRYFKRGVAKARTALDLATKIVSE